MPQRLDLCVTREFTTPNCETQHQTVLITIACLYFLTLRLSLSVNLLGIDTLDLDCSNTPNLVIFNTLF